MKRIASIEKAVEMGFIPCIDRGDGSIWIGEDDDVKHLDCEHCHDTFSGEHEVSIEEATKWGIPYAQDGKIFIGD